MSVRVWESELEVSEGWAKDLFNPRRFLWSSLSDLWDEEPIKALRPDFFVEDDLFLELKLFFLNELIDLLGIKILEL